MVRDGIEDGLNGHRVFRNREGERGREALKGVLGRTLGLEAGPPSRLTSLGATWARNSGGKSAQPLLP